MSIPESEDVLIETIRDGVAKGILGVRESTGVFYQQGVSPNLDSVVLRGEVAKRLKKEQEELEGEVEEGHVPPEEGEEEKETEEKKKEGVINSIHFRAQIPWDKISAIIGGVIRPLKDKGLPPEITIEIKADSEEGFDRTTLDSKVKETLTQIGAKIEEWKEK